jgi:hypothetical protein
VKIISVEKVVPAAPVTFMAQQETVTLIAELAARFSKKLDLIHQDVIARNAVPIPKSNTPPFSVASPAPRAVDPPKPKKLRIAVVGLFKEQFGHVQEAVNGRADMIWLDKDDAAPFAPISTDFVIVQRHTSHRWWDAMQAQFPGRVFFVDGGIQQVTQKTYDILSKQ